MQAQTTQALKVIDPISWDFGRNGNTALATLQEALASSPHKCQVVYVASERHFTVLQSKDVSIEALQTLFDKSWHGVGCFYRPKVEEASDKEGNRVVKLVCPGGKYA